MSEAEQFAGRGSFSAAARRFTAVTIDGIEGPVRIRSLKNSEFAKVEALQTQVFGALAAGKKADTAKIQQAKFTLLQLCIVDENGEPLFAPKDWDVFRGMDSGAVSALEKSCTDHCGIEGVDVEELAKN